ncbi:MAG: Rrf2 family transcriptional regulator [Bryobacteraceae bacterium]
MNTSVKGEYALQALFDLSQQVPGKPIRIADIARRRGIPQKFLELILAGLKQGGFVQSRRGAEGGYLLARAPEAITIGQVIRFMELSRSPHSAARQDVDSPFREVWREVDQAVSDVLDRVNFSDLVRQWRDKRGSYVANWDI